MVGVCLAADSRTSGLHVEHVDHDARDVVATPALIGEADELGDGGVGVLQPTEDRGDHVGLDLVEEPVAAQQEAVAGHGGELPGVDLDLGVDPELVAREIRGYVHRNRDEDPTRAPAPRRTPCLSRARRASRPG